MEDVEMENSTSNRQSKQKDTMQEEQPLSPPVQSAVNEIETMAANYWKRQYKEKKVIPFDASVVEHVYQILMKHDLDCTCIKTLESSYYLESYLWPNYSSKSSISHLLSIIMMLNEKFEQQFTKAWNLLLLGDDTDHHGDEEGNSDRYSIRFQLFLNQVISLAINPQGETNIKSRSLGEQVNYLVFIIHCFGSLDQEEIRNAFLKLVSLPLWIKGLNSERKRETQFQLQPSLKKHWNRLQKKFQKDSNAAEVNFIPAIMEHYVSILYSLDPDNDNPHQYDLKKSFCEHSLELFTDLLSQIPTRRFFRIVLEDSNILVKSKLSKLSLDGRNDIRFNQLLDRLNQYLYFCVDDHSGTPLTKNQMLHEHISKLVDLQRIAFKYYGEKLRDLSLCNLSKIEARESLLEFISKLEDNELIEFCERLQIIDQNQKSNMTRELLTEILITSNEKKLPQIDDIDSLPTTPNEMVLWDSNILPLESDAASFKRHPLALPKINLQFLTLQDYLLRNFSLYRLESANKIRNDLEMAITNMNPRRAPTGKVHFAGSHPMALPIKSFTLTKILNPNIGETKPSKVQASLTYSLRHCQAETLSAWEQLKKHDVVFLVSLKPTVGIKEERDPQAPFPQRFGVQYVRCCEIVLQKDNLDNVAGISGEGETMLVGTERTMIVEMDEAQYALDQELLKNENPYKSFNLMIRRKSKDNTFKAILETIRNLIHLDIKLPGWLHSIVLGNIDDYEPPKKLQTIDACDTFVDIDHVKQSFQNRNIIFSTNNQTDLAPPFKLIFPHTDENEEDDDEDDDDDDDGGEKNRQLLVEPYKIAKSGIFSSVEKKNTIRFTPNQIQAIISSMNHGITSVFGPPGTGKSEVIGQIVSNLYNNFSSEKILIIANSNYTLRRILNKIEQRNIDETHLLRLGHDDSADDNVEGLQKDFSIFGRVNFILQHRLDLLNEIEKLGKSLYLENLQAGHTCESAIHFYLAHVLSRWEAFRQMAENERNNKRFIQKHFPFNTFFENENIFKGESFEDDMLMAETCFRHITRIVDKLKEYRAFEIIRSANDRGNYLISKHAKVIAMTCKDASLRRQHLLDIRFQYDNLIIVEANQFLEIETFVSLLLQNNHSRLKRVVLMGDIEQLPPTIKTEALKRYCKMDQSMFERLVRLKIPTINLDWHGSLRPSFIDLIRWSYPHLKNIQMIVDQSKIYQTANAGFAHEYQLINVEGYMNYKGETEPTPGFYQNLAEAEYVVALYMFMRLIQYPAEKITILSTYEGQVRLITDVLDRRCKFNPLMGMPRKVTTIDRYQGQQNDYILLSLVRTDSPGLVRDPRRLLVAFSRARLGLYVFCRKSLVESCRELTPVFSQCLLKKPQELQLIMNEVYPTERNLSEIPKNVETIPNVIKLGKIVWNMMNQRLDEVKKQQIQFFDTLHKYHQQNSIETKTPMISQQEDTQEHEKIQDHMEE